ncbi:hypothetical protein Nepgr_014292 [Nepenthes gracilis]|uniref:SAM-dependent MTase RsmB/NOP-type domain-containing protein n=1 Tax=Nepenthes gracilis TaxID=150966 RepID=A0AAD3XQ57_NEPGR|nr:hypothetical protein Nepgr_014292 [Nepenthes gracilis]
MSPVSDLSERYCYNPTLYWNPHVEEYFIKAYGADHFASISKALTHPCCYSCIRVNILKTTSNAVIEKLSMMLHETSNGNAMNGMNICEMEGDRNSDMGPIQENFTKEYTLHYNPKGHDKIATKSLEDLDLLDGCLKHDPVFKCHIPGLDYVVFVRGTGPHKVEYAYAPDQPSKEVIVSRKCAESVLRGAQVYVPGVLACSAHVEKGDAVAVSVAVEQPEPDGKWGIGITRGIVLHGLQTDPHFSQRKGLYIGQGTTMMPRAGIFRALEGVAIRMTSRVFDLPSFNDVLEGEIFLQNLPSIITAHVLDPQKGERILDMCAAPGGKTTAIAMLMKDDGEVVAVDRSHNKVQDIQNLAAEMGLKSIVAYKLDALKAVSRRNESNDINASKFVEDSPSLELLKSESNNTNNNNVLRKEICVNGKANLQKSITTANTKRSNQRTKNGPGKNQVGGGRVEKSKGFSPSSFDRVLLDAPCSALGLRPRLFAGEETLESLRNHARYQRRMFDQAVQLVQAGGVIVYSTCTINPGENEALVRYALDTYKFLSLAPQHPSVGGPGLIGSYNFSDGHVEEWLRPSEAELVQRFDPSLVDTIGFFIAKFNVGSKDA